MKVAGSAPASIRVHQYVGLAPGPRLIVLGAVHGNETCGTVAIHRLIDELDKGVLRVERGVLTLIPMANPWAYQRGERFTDRNLNRGLKRREQPQNYEDHLANALCPLLEAHEVLLDLHSFQAQGQPFIMLGPQNNRDQLQPFSQAADEARLAAHLGPRRIVEGWLEAYASGVQRRIQNRTCRDTRLLDVDYGIGTTEFMRRHGGYGVTLECGQHGDPQAREVAYHAICQTLALLQLTTQLSVTPPASAFEVLRLAEVVDKVAADDRFLEPWSSFATVRARQAVACRGDGTTISAPSDGCIVFPNEQAPPGSEWFYFAQPSDRQIVGG
jgi:uncharacterized protein